jgi:Mor family transcriptional regulator
MFGRFGEKNHRAKLREYQVMEILAKREAGVPVREMAKEYGVSSVTIYAILKGESWRDSPHRATNTYIMT